MKSDRLDIRLTRPQKRLIVQGAKKAGQTMAAFVIASAIGNAQAVLGLGSFAK